MNTPTPYRIVSRIYEGGATYPIVIHIFYGKTPAEAQRYFQAHLKSDSFFRGCTTNQRFSDFTCRQEQTSERWNGKSWVAA